VVASETGTHRSLSASRHGRGRESGTRLAGQSRPRAHERLPGRLTTVADGGADGGRTLHLPRDARADRGQQRPRRPQDDRTRQHSLCHRSGAGSRVKAGPLLLVLLQAARRRAAPGRGGRQETPRTANPRANQATATSGSATDERLLRAAACGGEDLDRQFPLHDSCGECDWRQTRDCFEVVGSPEISRLRPPRRE
jgi:hypothetical protein